MALSDKAAAGRRSHALFDRTFRFLCLASALTVLLVLLGILGSIVYGGWPTFQEFGFWGFLSGTRWNVAADVYGAWPAVAGTLSCARGSVSVTAGSTPRG